MRKCIALLLLLCFCSLTEAQNPLHQHSYTDDDEHYTEERGDLQSGTNRMLWGRDTTDNDVEEVPIGVTQWTVDENFGNIIPAENKDTAVHMFHYFNETNGYNGEYNILGNLGSPRLSRIYFHREPHTFVFLQPFDFVLGGLRDFRFSNTLSPMTNLAYHKVGNRTDGQERLHAYFASNINKQAGIGMKFDYLYGRGYYNSQANSQFSGTLFGYYLGDRYNMHTYVNLNHFKMAENGGIEDDAYIRNPQSFPRRYGSKDIPTSLTDTWNRNDSQDAFLTHRYNLGFYRDIAMPDSLKPQMPDDNELLRQLTDSTRRVLSADTLQRAFVLDSLRSKWTAEQIIPQEFVPVTSIIHTLKIDNLKHTYYSYNTPEAYYTHLFYGDLTSVKDRTRALAVRNTLALALREGFNKWAQMGITLFAFHELKHYTLPDLHDGMLGRSSYNEHDLAVGGAISRTQGKFVHYNVTGNISLAGDDVGDFEVKGTAELDVPLGRKDTLQVMAHGFIINKNPEFYYEHYHSQFTWWDNDWLNKELKSRIEGAISIPRTRTQLSVGAENVKNYTYFAMRNTLTEEGNPASTLPRDYTHDVAVRQESGNIQVFSATLSQNLAFGPFHWDNEVTYQTTSNANVLPLPKISLYSNMYLHFRIARVLNVELGGDLRYFTSYYAPDYSPSIGQFATQDADFARVKIGNYPIVNVYANLHIKHCRLYVAMTHLNAGTGRMFWAPHYPMDPRTIHFGVSWNFFN